MVCEHSHLEILQLQLSSWRMQTTCVEGGEQALNAMAAAALVGKPYDLAILDMHMPQMDGLQLAHAITARPELAKTRLIMLTSTYEAGNAREREQANILRCVSKPIRQSELYEVVSGVLAKGYRLDAEADASRSPATEAASGIALSGRILLAEDNPINQEVAKAILAKLGLAVDVANNGEEALALIKQQTYDLILMDCQMPVMDGYQATAAIRMREAGTANRLRIVALTANAMEGDRDQCIKAGMDDYLAKPYSISQLQQVLNRWLQTEKSPISGVAEPAAEAATKPETPAPVRAAAINLQLLDQLRELDPSGSMGLARKVLQVYLDSSGNLVNQAKQSIVAGNAEDLRFAAHSLKSSSANVGAETLSGLFKQLEGYAREGNLSDASTLFDSAQREYELARHEISALLAEDA